MRTEWTEVDLYFFYFFFVRGRTYSLGGFGKSETCQFISHSRACGGSFKLAVTRCRWPGFQRTTFSNTLHMHLTVVFSGELRLLSPFCSRPFVLSKGKEQGGGTEAKVIFYFYFVFVDVFCYFFLKRYGERYTWKHRFIILKKQVCVHVEKRGRVQNMYEGWSVSLTAWNRFRKKKILSKFSSNKNKLCYVCYQCCSWKNWKNWRPNWQYRNTAIFRCGHSRYCSVKTADRTTASHKKDAKRIFLLYIFHLWSLKWLSSFCSDWLHPRESYSTCFFRHKLREN